MYQVIYILYSSIYEARPERSMDVDGATAVILVSEHAYPQYASSSSIEVSVTC